MMLPEEFYKEIIETMNDDGFPFKNITTFVIVASITFQQGYTDSCKKDSDRIKFVNEVIKACKYLVKQGLISDKLYGFKDGFRGKIT